MTAQSNLVPRTPFERVRRQRVFSAALAAVLLVEVAAPSLARADGAQGTPQTVEQLANLAYEQTSAGKYSEAIATYMKAYEAAKAGAILYNIAAIYDRKMHERSLAIEYFRRYLQAPDAEPDFVRKATERLSALKAEVAAEEQARASVHVTALPPQPPPPPEAPVPPPSNGTGLRIAGVVVGAVGLLGLGGGFVLGSLAKSKYDDSNKDCSATSCSSSQGVSLEQQAGNLATWLTVAVVSGGVLLATGITLILVAPHGGHVSTGSLTLTPQASPAGGGLSFQGTF